MSAEGLFQLPFDVFLLLKERFCCLILFGLSGFASSHSLLLSVGVTHFRFGWKLRSAEWVPTVILFCIFESC